MTATNEMKAKALELAAKLSGNISAGSISIEQFPNAATSSQRERFIHQVAVYREELQALKSSLAETPRDVKTAADLLTAACFVADVDGDDPSIPQLKEAVLRRRGVRKYFRKDHRTGSEYPQDWNLSPEAMVGLPNSHCPSPFGRRRYARRIDCGT